MIQYIERNNLTKRPYPHWMITTANEVMHKRDVKLTMELAACLWIFSYELYTSIELMLEGSGVCPYIMFGPINSNEVNGE